LLFYWFRAPLLEGARLAFELLTDRERVEAFVASFGTAAPLVFMAIQVLQVIFAPIPGEATGFVGGYLFGAYAGCFYSTIALGVGSWINFSIGRYFGKRWVRRMVAADKIERYDYLLRHQGLLVVFLFFLFPGFPKDYLCLFLGVSTIPMRVFLPMATLGRIPGTLMLSLQGALVFEKNYLVFCLVLAINIIAVYFAYRYREALYKWVEKINGQSSQTIDDKQQ
jgi:uncharacterized membrane protein YdjX (TVP38/TMEM64 family)